MLTFVAVMIGIAVVVGAIWFVTRKPGDLGAGFPPGTRAFEAEMSLRIIVQMIEAREVSLVGATDPAEKAKLETQLSNLRSQARIHQATIDARDVSPGKMSFGVNPDSATVD